MIAKLPGRLWRRARLLGSCVHTPADLWIALRMLGWRLAVPVLKWALPLPRLVRLMWTDAPAGRSPRDQERITTLVHGLYGPRGGRLLDNCLERSLVTYRFLAEAGADPRLVVAVAAGEEQLRGHAWVTLAGEPVRETGEPLDEFAPLVVFGPGGAAVSSDAPPGAPATSPAPPGPGS